MQFRAGPVGAIEGQSEPALGHRGHRFETGGERLEAISGDRLGKLHIDLPGPDPREDLLGAGPQYEAAMIEEHELIAGLGDLTEIVGAEQEEVVGSKTFKEVTEDHPLGEVEPALRLIEQDDLGVGEERRRQDHPLTLALGERPVADLEGGKVEFFGERADPGLERGLAEATESAHHPERFAHRLGGVWLRPLDHRADVPEGLLPARGQVDPVQEDGPGRGAKETDQELEERRLPGPVRPRQATAPGRCTRRLIASRAAGRRGSEPKRFERS